MDLEQIWGYLLELTGNFVPMGHSKPLLFSLPWNIRLKLDTYFRQSNRLNVGVGEMLEHKKRDLNDRIKKKILMTRFRKMTATLEVHCTCIHKC